ncbi:MAG TPA: DNA polymerase IV [Candidatus Flavonifractor intestinipullorum]|uniref:DNA polymerase IV n=1 Tax=Candidatus Flavonifractor intestinipullorum TaxID=2838587 RepID=A0A9D2M9V4_9FIRM|nr:DNA polymerase IV [Candidatus Flavonifractor intestinipullorum]
MERVILHCDMNSFYASVELLSHPELREKPVVVCGDPESRHGIILAKNEAAKRFQIRTAETVWQARRKCPDLVLLGAHRDKYRHYSRLINGIYGRYTDLVEPFSIDESWLDLTGSLHLFGGDAAAVADEIRAAVRRETGLTLSAGVSFNKTFAKMGSDYRKPDATTVITRENFRELLWPLPVGALLFVGRAAERTLTAHGVRTIGDLARLEREELVHLLGKLGGSLHDAATGAEHDRVVPLRDKPPPKSVGSGLTFPRDLEGWEALRSGTALLSDQVAERLREAGMKCTAVQVTIRDPDFRDLCRQRRLDVPTCVGREIRDAAFSLIRGVWRAGAPVRALTVTAQNLVRQEEAGEQLDLFTAGAAAEREKLERLARAVDGVRRKYGREALSLASEAGKRQTKAPPAPRSSER